jgi:hypothetical protein
MHVTADSNGDTIAAWAIDVIYDSSAISYTSTTTYDGFSVPVVTSQALTGSVYGPNAAQVSITSTKLQEENNMDFFKGTDILLMSLDFDILSTATSGIRIFSATNRFMTNLGKEPIIELQDITIDDSNSIASIGEASVLIESPPLVVQLLTVSTPRHVVLKPDGEFIPSTITGMLVYGSYGESNVAVSGDLLECEAVTTGLQLTTTGSCDSVDPTGGSPAVTNSHPFGVVKATHKSSGITSDVPIVTYITKSVSIVLDADNLYKVCSSDSDMYESTRIRKMAVFDRGAGYLSDPIDVSNTIYDIPVSASSGAEIVDMFYVGGVAPGASVISPTPVATGRGIVYTDASVTVSDTLSTTSIGFSIVKMQYVDWTAGNTSPVIMDKNPLTAEGDEQILFPAFHPAGVILTKTQNDNLLQEVTSTNELVYEITETLSSSGYRYWNGEVAHDAITQGGAGALAINTPTIGSMCTTIQAFTNISLPSAVSATINLPDPILAVKDDPCDGPYKSSTNDGIILTVLFSDGTNVLFTRDDRTTWELTNNPHTVTITERNANKMRIEAPIGAPTHTVTVTATVMGLVSNSIDIAVVTATGLLTSVDSIDGRTGGVQSTSLKRVHCAPGIYQGLKTLTSMLISNGASVPTSLITYDIPGNGVLEKIGDNVFVGKIVGTETVTSSYMSLTTTTVVTVLTESVFVNTFEFSAPSTFSASTGSTTVSLDPFRVFPFLLINHIVGKA